MSVHSEPNVIPLESQAEERRLALRLLQHWREIAGERRWPLLADIDQEDMRDIWSSCFILKLQEDNAPLLVHVGAELQPEGQDLTGGSVENLPPQSLLECAVSYIEEVVERKVPITVGGVFTDPRGTRILYRSILLPLSETGSAIDHLLGAASCRPLQEDDGIPRTV